MNWIKKARGLKRISSRELAELCGKSMNYIQKIEAGDRYLPDATAGEIYDALGFTPAQVPFDSTSLLETLEPMDDDEVVNLGYVEVDGIIYFNLVAVYQNEVDGFMPIAVKYARKLLQSQLELFG